MTFQHLQLALLSLLSAASSLAQSGLLTTAAGNGSSIYSGDNIPANLASIGSPSFMAVDLAGNLYITDSANSRIYKVNTATGVLTSIAGGGSGGDGGLATAALLTAPCGIAVDAAGNIYISESCFAASGGSGGSFSISRIRRIDAVTGIITTIAGNGTNGFSGDGGPAINASLNIPAGLSLDSSGALYVADSSNFRVRRINLANGTITTVAGNGTFGPTVNGIPAILASAGIPVATAFDWQGNMYFSDVASACIRKIDALTGIITTVAGTGTNGFNGDNIPAASAQLSFPNDLRLDTGGNLYFVDRGNGRIRRIDASTGIITTIAGGGSQPAADGVPALSAMLNQPFGLALSSTNRLYFSERPTSKVWALDVSAALPSSTTTLAVNPTSVAAFEQITLTATITPPTATGTVTFSTGPNTLGTATVVNGVATTTSTLPFGGTFPIEARYSGNTTVAPSTSSPVNVTVKAPTTIFLFTNTTTATLGQTLTFDISLSPSAATGNIQILNGPTVIGTVPVNNGAATFSTSQLPLGANSLTARYQGDSNHNPSTSTPQIVTVKAASTLTLASSLNPANAGQTVIFTASVTPASATGSIQFLNGATPLGTSNIISGIATFSTSQLAPGTYSITATYSGDTSTSNSTSSPLNQTIKSASTVSLASSANPASPGQSITFTASVTPPTATGTIEFKNGATILGTATLAGGTASFATSQLATGTSNITAHYSGDTLNAPSASAPVAQSIKATSTITVASSVNPANASQSVTFTATVTPNTATGTVQFFNGATSLGTAPLSSGVATISTSQLPSGTNSITASYSGDTATTASTSSPLSQTIRAAATVTLTSSANPAQVGQSVTFTATVSPSTATGAIQFFNGTTLLSTVPLTNGSATFATSQLARGTYSITASYNGDSQTSPSTSTPLSQAIKATTTITLNGSPDPATAGQNVTFTARLNPTAATGTVQFLNGNTPLATITLASGVATFSTRDLAPGTYSIVASYSGDSAFLASTSAPQSQTIRFRTVITLASTPNPATTGQQVTFTATANPTTATGSITFRRGTVTLGSAPLVNGTATFATSDLPLGPTSISAQYAGDPLHAPDTSNSVRQVTRTVSILALATSANPTTAGEPTTFTATITPATATGAVQFLNGATALGTAQVVNGVARLTTERLAAGTFTITANYNGDSFNTPATATLSQVANAAISACAVTYNVTSQTATSFAASISISNTGTATIEPWALTFTWPGTQQITQAVNATFIQNGRNARLNSLASNRVIVPGATLTGITLAANYSGTNTAPPAFTVNGVRCQ